MSDTELLIVGAGAAGIGAAKAAAHLEIEYKVFEASHRIGGRAYTESPTADIHFDLGCHWIHLADRNPFSKLVDPYGYEVTKNPWQPSFKRNGEWLGAGGARQYHEFEERTFKAADARVKAGEAPTLFDLPDRNSEWCGFYDYWMSLLTSADSDQVATADFTDFAYSSEMADWPVREGLGNLIARFGADIGAQLNTPVREINSKSERSITVTTPRGSINASSVLITVSTGVLNAGDIKFTPGLPDWKCQAIHDLPMGNHNRICLIYDRNVFGDYDMDHAILLEEDGGAMFFEIHPFGLNYAVAGTGGRFADWLERAGQEASVDHAREKIIQLFGNDAGRHINKSIVTAWRGDPWIKGAYSAVKPGGHGARAGLAKSIDERIFFAGEATSPHTMQTVHGAYISGVHAALKVARKSGRDSQTPDAEKLSWQLAKPW